MRRSTPRCAVSPPRRPSGSRRSARTSSPWIRAGTTRAEAAATIWQAAFATRLADRFAAEPGWFEPELAGMIDAGSRVSAVELGRAMFARTSFHTQAQRVFDRYDLLLTPQMPAGAWPIEGPPAAIGGKPTPAMFDRLPFTYPVEPDGPSGGERALRLHGRWIARRAPDRRALARRHPRAAGRRRVRAGRALGRAPPAALAVSLAPRSVAGRRLTSDCRARSSRPSARLDATIRVRDRTGLGARLPCTSGAAMSPHIPTGANSAARAPSGARRSIPSREGGSWGRGYTGDRRRARAGNASRAVPRASGAIKQPRASRGECRAPRADCRACPRRRSGRGPSRRRAVTRAWRWSASARREAPKRPAGRCRG